MEKGSCRERGPSEGPEEYCSRAPGSGGPDKARCAGVVGRVAPPAGSSLRLEEAEVGLEGTGLQVDTRTTVCPKMRHPLRLSLRQGQGLIPIAGSCWK